MLDFIFIGYSKRILKIPFIKTAVRLETPFVFTGMEPEPNKLPPSTADDGSLRKGGGGRALEDSDEEDYAFDPVMEEDRDGRGNEAEAADDYDEDEDADDGLSSIYEDEEVEDNEGF